MHEQKTLLFVLNSVCLALAILLSKEGLRDLFHEEQGVHTARVTLQPSGNGVQTVFFRLDVPTIGSAGQVAGAALAGLAAARILLSLARSNVQRSRIISTRITPPRAWMALVAGIATSIACFLLRIYHTFTTAFGHIG